MWNREVFGFLDMQIGNLVEELNALDDLVSNGSVANENQRKVVIDQF